MKHGVRTAGRRDSGGFTLTESLIAVAILTLGVLPLIGVLGVALRTKEIGLREAEAALFGKSVASAFEAALPGILERQRTRTSLTEHAIWAPVSRASDARGEGLDLTDRDELEEFRVRSRFNWVHHGYFDPRFFGEIGDFNGSIALANLEREPPTDRDDPYFALPGDRFDWRMAVRVSRWRFERDGNNDERAYPAAYDYAIFVFGGSRIVPGDLEYDGNGDGAFDASSGSDLNSAASFAIDRGTGVVLVPSAGESVEVRFPDDFGGAGPAGEPYFDDLGYAAQSDNFGSDAVQSDSFALVEQAVLPESLREAVTVELGGGSVGPYDGEVDSFVARGGLGARPASVVRWTTSQRNTFLAPALLGSRVFPRSGEEFDAVLPYNLLVLPAFCNAVITGTVEL